MNVHLASDYHCRGPNKNFTVWHKSLIQESCLPWNCAREQSTKNPHLPTISVAPAVALSNTLNCNHCSNSLCYLQAISRHSSNFPHSPAYLRFFAHSFKRLMVMSFKLFNTCFLEVTKMNSKKTKRRNCRLTTKNPDCQLGTVQADTHKELSRALHY